MRALKFFTLAAAGLIAASCATTPITTAPNAPSGPSTIPSDPLDLGGWQRGSAAGVLSEFERTVAQRYGQGLPLSAVAADLRRNEFRCNANQDSGERGDPPEQICRKTVTLSECTHTWQVHLFDQNGDDRLARTRGLYDRRCGGDGLLGGPT